MVAKPATWDMLAKATIFLRLLPYIYSSQSPVLVGLVYLFSQLSPQSGLLDYLDRKHAPLMGDNMSSLSLSLLAHIRFLDSKFLAGESRCKCRQY